MKSKKLSSSLDNIRSQYQLKIFKLPMKGWYNFQDLPQGYIRIANLNCGTDANALKQARKILGTLEADLEIVDYSQTTKQKDVIHESDVIRDENGDEVEQ